MVCSEHFADGHPTVENPDPTLKLGYSTGVKKQRRVLIRQTDLQTTEFQEEPNESVSMDVDCAEESSCGTCADSKKVIAALQDEIKILREENLKLTSKVDEET
eukprot:gene19454-21378_t